MTYSILARDAQTGQMGAAIQSHWFGVGRETLWPAEYAQGFVVCQAFVEPLYGLQGLQALREGQPAARALETLRQRDPGRASRQVAILSAQGEVAAFTGASCVEHAEHVVDTQLQVSCQANLMRNEGVPLAMLQAYREHLQEPLERRLMAALHAAQQQGGDLRGQQSAALLVSDPGDAPGSHRTNLRVDDSEHPLEELERLLARWSAYQTLEQLQAATSLEVQEQLLRTLLAQTDNPEVLFWAQRALHRLDLPPAGLSPELAELARRLNRPSRSS